MGNLLWAHLIKKNLCQQTLLLLLVCICLNCGQHDLPWSAIKKLVNDCKVVPNPALVNIPASMPEERDHGKEEGESHGRVHIRSRDADKEHVVDIV